MTEIRHFTDDGSPIKVEVSLTASGDREMTRGGITDKIKELDDAALFHAFHTIFKIARKTEQLIADLPSSAPDHPHPLTGAEVEFGIKFDSHLNAVVTVGGEASVMVKLTWSKP